MIRRLVLTAVVLLLLTVVATACGGASSGSTASPSTTASAPSADTAAAIKDLTGHWFYEGVFTKGAFKPAEGQTVFVFAPDGTFLLEDDKGTWTIDPDGKLQLSAGGSTAQMDYEIRGDRLRIYNNPEDSRFYTQYRRKL